MKYYSSQKGFTLVEMIISLALFTVVAVIAIGALLRITDANKKSHTLKIAINNLNFALESMSREMRVGTNYAAYISDTPDIDLSINEVKKNGNYITTGSWFIYFNSSKIGTFADNTTQCSLIYAYKYASQTISKAEQVKCGESIGGFNPIISPDVKITDSILYVDSNNILKPRAFFWLKGYAGSGTRNKTEFELQTTVSQRIGT